MSTEQEGNWTDSAEVWKKGFHSKDQLALGLIKTVFVCQKRVIFNREVLSKHFSYNFFKEGKPSLFFSSWNTLAYSSAIINELSPHLICYMGNSSTPHFNYFVFSFFLKRQMKTCACLDQGRSWWTRRQSLDENSCRNSLLNSGSSLFAYRPSACRTICKCRLLFCYSLKNDKGMSSHIINYNTVLFSRQSEANMITKLTNT